MEGLHGAGVTHRRGDLRSLRGKAGGKAVADALHFHKIAAVVGMHRQRLNAHAVDQVLGGGSANDVAQAFLALGESQFQFSRTGQEPDCFVDHFLHRRVSRH